jgi:hypothetical protein
MGNEDSQRHDFEGSTDLGCLGSPGARAEPMQGLSKVFVPPEVYDLRMLRDMFPEGERSLVVVTHRQDEVVITCEPVIVVAENGVSFKDLAARVDAFSPDNRRFDGRRQLIKYYLRQAKNGFEQGERQRFEYNTF